MKVKVSELSWRQILPSIITTLVGGPCAGQKVNESYFDGRKSIYVMQNPAPTYMPQPEDPVANPFVCLYQLREGRYPDGRSFVVFTDPSMPDAEVFSACESLRKQTHPDFFAE
ncbi:hypothetical protein [Pseudomonas extremaustralis]|uniref:hypothetical protein n=1 Tax=Pseudomonas extremaustralis TaxID=359110 RepID=UPI0028637DF0|nr:hypothetical protein [Pseudomonas extremaustralis]MDR6579991.1 hypothetical protein [Pseudomonas extremaustralis]